MAKTKTPAISVDIAKLRPADLSENARIVLAKRYLKKDENGQPIEQPEVMFWRVARVIAEEDRKFGASDKEIEALANEFYDLMTKRLFEPNSPTLMNAGRPLGQLSACFVVPVEDALSNGKDGIYDTLKSMALIHQSGGGTGFSFSRIRPKGAMVKSSTGVASGPISFMDLYNSSTDVVKQGGTRRGANMGILRVDHPDVLEFIDCKQDITKITNFNISVAITDAFMEAVEKGTEYTLLDPRTREPYVGKDGVVQTLDAREVFDKIVLNAWRTGEPGVYYIDRANHYNPVPHLGEYEATNPCGEQPLLPNDVCNLGSVNVGMFALPEGQELPLDDVPEAFRSFAWARRIDWPAYRAVVRKSTHFLDNVIDANAYPLPQIHELAHKIRRIGLGVMGFADLLIRIGVPYNSEDGVEVGRAVMRFLDEEAKNASEGLSETRGVFPEWEKSIWGPDATCARKGKDGKYRWDGKGERIRPERRLRNCNVDTVAPTGTISIFAQCSGGIEPIFAVAFMRNQAGSLMPDVNEDFVAVAKQGGWYSEDLMKRIAEQGHIHFDEVPADVQRVFVTSHDITPEWHVRMQAAFQEWTDSAISKTTNFPNNATPEQVREIYELAFKLQCKGVTVYRDGSRDGQVLSTGATKSPAQQAEEQDALKKAEAKVAELEKKLKEAEAQAEINGRSSRFGKRKRPPVLKGTTRQMNSPIGDVFVTINEDDFHSPFEVFATLGKAGSIAMADIEAIGRLISLGLRFGIPISEIHSQLRGISSDKAIGFGQNKVLSVPDAIAQAIEQREQEKEGIQQELMPESVPTAVARDQLKEYDGGGEQYMNTCPDCQSQLVFEAGCRGGRCANALCGFSECS